MMKRNGRRAIGFIFRPLLKRNLCWLSLLVLAYFFLATFGSIANISLKKVFRSYRGISDDKEESYFPPLNPNTRIFPTRDLIYAADNEAAEKDNEPPAVPQYEEGALEQFEDFGINKDFEDPLRGNALLTNNSKNFVNNDGMNSETNLMKKRKQQIHPKNYIYFHTEDKDLPPLTFEEIRLKSKRLQYETEKDPEIVKQTQNNLVSRITNYLYQVGMSSFFNPKEPLIPAQKKGVVLFTNYRSGSTFLGELFNQHPDTFYIFEPLLPFSGSCLDNRKLKTKYLHGQLKCDFPFMPDVYQNIEVSGKMSQVDIQCLYNNFCFRFKTKELCHRSMCFAPTSLCRKCGPVSLKKVMNSCRSKKMSVVKIIRMCDIMDLEDIVNDPTMDIKVIHLIRDPRGIESSRLKINQKWSIKADAQATCERLLGNAMKGSGVYREATWLNKRYLRIRYEDLSIDPVRVAKDIYSFVGLKMLPSIDAWIQQNTRFVKRENEKRSNPYSTRRDSVEAMQAWRKHLTFDEVDYIQNVCSRTLDYFGYKNVTNSKELLNFNITLVT